MDNKRGQAALGITLACVSAALMGRAVQAQESTAGETQASRAGELEEIIVSARKRDESILNVPVVETAITQTQLGKLQTVDMQDLPNVVPGLQFGRGELSIGTQVSIRGVGSTSYDQGVDQSVSLNIDGMAPGSGLAFESGLFDLAQVEVLRGPQGLFFGKSTPGGVISLRTADPTDRFEVSATTSYEFEAKTNREEAIISGPVTDTLKLRLASMYSTSEGYFYNAAVATPGLGGTVPTDSREPRSSDYLVRGTALWEPTSQLQARLKLNLVHDRATNQESTQLISCPEGAGFAPSGIPFIGPNNNCQLSRNNYVVYMNPADYPGIINNGVPFVDTQQEYGILELNYRPADTLTLTSVTADYQLMSNVLVNAFETSGAGTPIAAENFFHRREFTEEVRANSDFSSPLNFTAGVFYEDGLITQHVIAPGSAVYKFPAIVSANTDPVSIKTYSAFGQLRWKILPELEAAAGLRWTDEARTESPLDQFGSAIPVLRSRVASDNVAPEFTLTYKPLQDVTVFAAYKQAYKSGSFSLNTEPSAGTDNSFGEEKAQGGEIGLKSLLLERRLSANLAAYLYNYGGLQVGAIEPSNNSSQINIQTVNAGAARTYGVDFDTTYRPLTIAGLTLNGAINWDRARYLTLNNVPCWGGQTIAEGCNSFPVAGGGFTAQSLSGTPMIRAPEWQVHLGFDYELPLESDYKLVFSSNNAFSSRFVTFLAVDRPNHDNFQGSFVKSDLSVAIHGPNDAWELAVVGKNLSDKLTVGNCAPANYANAVVFGGQTTGGVTAGPAGASEVGCFVDAGREVWLRLTVRPFGSSQ